MCGGRLECGPCAQSIHKDPRDVAKYASNSSMHRRPEVNVNYTDQGQENMEYTVGV